MTDGNTFLRKQPNGNGFVSGDEELELFTNNLKPDDEFLNHFIFIDKSPEDWNELNKCYKELLGLEIKFKELNKSLEQKKEQLNNCYKSVLNKTTLGIATLRFEINNFIKLHLNEIAESDSADSHKIKTLESVIIEIEEKIKLKPVTK